MDIGPNLEAVFRKWFGTENYRGKYAVRVRKWAKVPQCGLQRGRLYVSAKWLKEHLPVEFMCAVLSDEPIDISSRKAIEMMATWKDKVLNEARKNF